MSEPNGELTPERIEAQALELVAEIEAELADKQTDADKKEAVEFLVNGEEFKQQPNAIQIRVKEMLKAKGLYFEAPVIPIEKRKPPLIFKEYRLEQRGSRGMVVLEVKVDGEAKVEKVFPTSIEVPEEIELGSPKEREFLDAVATVRKEIDRGYRINIDPDKTDPNNPNVNANYVVGGKKYPVTLKKIPEYIKDILRSREVYGNDPSWRKWRNALLGEIRDRLISTIIAERFVPPKSPEPPQPVEPTKQMLTPQEVGLAPERAVKLRESLKAQLVEQYARILQSKYPKMTTELAWQTAEVIMEDEDIEDAFQEALAQLQAHKN